MSSKMWENVEILILNTKDAKGGNESEKNKIFRKWNKIQKVKHNLNQHGSRCNLPGVQRASSGSRSHDRRCRWSAGKARPRCEKARSEGCSCSYPAAAPSPESPSASSPLKRCWKRDSRPVSNFNIQQTFLTSLNFNSYRLSYQNSTNE